VQLVRRLRSNGAVSSPAIGNAAAAPEQDTWLARTLRGAAAR
jgi:hypothetical protein